MAGYLHFATENFSYETDTEALLAETRKSYGEGCLAAHALDLIGDRWALLIVRELMLGPRRFGAIKARLPGIATNMLTRRLADLEAAGVLTHTTLPPPAAVPVYELTPQGLGLWPILRELCRWAVTVPGHDPRLPISPVALMLSMQTMLRPAPSVIAAGFGMEDESFLVTTDGERIETVRAVLPAGEMQFEAPPNLMAAVIYGPQPLAAQIAAGTLRFTGDPERGQAFVDRFRLGPV